MTRDRAALSLDETSRTDWREIELRAHDAGIAELLRIEETPLNKGDLVAWRRCTTMGRTDGFSSIHRFARVDHPEPSERCDGVGRTMCGQVVPPAQIRLALGPVWFAALPRCGACEMEHVEPSIGER